MDQDDLTATHFVTSRVVAFFLVVGGVFFLFRPDWLGWSALSKALGGDDRLLGVGVACSFFLLASLSFEKNQMRVRIAEVFTALNQLLYGKHYVRDREAIEVLVQALERGEGESAVKAHEHLVRLTGQNFAADPAVWRSWWEANQRHFELRREGIPKKKGQLPQE